VTNHTEEASQTTHNHAVKKCIVPLHSRGQMARRPSIPPDRELEHYRVCTDVQRESGWGELLEIQDPSATLEPTQGPACCSKNNKTATAALSAATMPAANWS
jgi:hypothetical protein